MLVTCPECATRYEVDDSAFSAGGRAVRCNHCGCEWYQIGPSTIGAPAPGSDAQSNPSAASESYNLEPLEINARAPEPNGAASLTNATEAAAAASAPPARAAPRALQDDGAGPDISLPAVYDSDDPVFPDDADKSAPPPTRHGPGPALLGGVVVAAAAVVAAVIFAPDMFQQAATQSPPQEDDSIAAVFAPPEAAAPETATAPQATVIPELSPLEASVPPLDVPLASDGPGVVFVEYKYDLVERPEGPALEIWGVVANNGPESVVAPTIEIISRDQNGKALQTWIAQPEIDVLGVGQSARFTSRMMFPAGPVHDVDFYLTNQ